MEGHHAALPGVANPIEWEMDSTLISNRKRSMDDLTDWGRDNYNHGPHTREPAFQSVGDGSSASSQIYDFCLISCLGLCA